MIRQYRIVKKTPDGEMTLLLPGVDGAEYNIPEIRDSVEFLRQQPRVTMLGIEFRPTFYSIVVIEDEELRANHFVLEAPEDG